MEVRINAGMNNAPQAMKKNMLIIKIVRHDRQHQSRAQQRSLADSRSAANRAPKNQAR